MKTLKIIVKGYVQRVGYREEVERIARELGITGYAKNLEDKELTVEIIAQHKDDDILKQFADKIKIKHYPIEVREIKTEVIDTKEDHAIFTVIHGPLEKEFGERMVEARRSLDKIENKLDNGFSDLGNEVKEMRGELGSEIKGMRQELGTEMKGVRQDLNNFNQSTQQQFNHLDGKYHKVSEKLEVLEDINKHLKDIAEVLKQFKPK